MLAIRRTLSMFQWPVVTVAALLTVGIVVSPQSGRASAPPPTTFSETFDGAPGSPTPVQLNNWDVTVHNRDDRYRLEPMAAMHGADCAGPPATHQVATFDDAVFSCRNHMMTAIKAEGYGAIYLTPNNMVDFSQGTGTIGWDMSTLRTTERDWVDVWITPYEDNLQTPLQEWMKVDFNGPPRRAIHIVMNNFSGGTNFKAEVFRDYVATDIGGPGAGWDNYENHFTPDAARRDRFEAQLTGSRLKFGMPAYGLTWIDANIPGGPLDWTQGVVQFAHHSYNPEKDCPAGNVCTPNTWHWDNISVTPSAPFTIIHTDRRFTDATSPKVNFQSAAPAGANLRFSGYGDGIEVSFDSGATWQAAQLQRIGQTRALEHAASYWTPIPAGAASATFRGGSCWCGNWVIRDMSVWALNAGSSATVGAAPTTVAPPSTVPPPATQAPPTSTPTVPTTVEAPTTTASAPLTFAPPLTTGLPPILGLGLANAPGATGWMTSSGSPWNYRYQYLAGGANTGSGWATWNPNGDFATSYMQESGNIGSVPVFTYYQLVQSSPSTGANEAQKNYSNLNNQATMAAYYADFKLLLDKIRAYGKPVIVHVEPDLPGFMQQRVAAGTNSATDIPAMVAGSGYPAVAGIPNTYQGFNLALLKLRDQYAPNALLATHVSSWSTGVDIGTNTDPSLDVAALAAKTATFLNTAGTGANAGASRYDLVFIDPADRDAGFYQHVYSDGGAHWWDLTNTKFPNFSRYQDYISGITAGTGLNAMLWQVPIGNTVTRSQNSTSGHYQDNRVQYWLGGPQTDGHLAGLVNSGVIAILFGRGADGPTNYDDSANDGITNPAPINGNIQPATQADDDGGYLRQRAQVYYGSPITLAAIPTPTPTTAAPTTAAPTTAAPTTAAPTTAAPTTAAPTTAAPTTAAPTSVVGRIVAPVQIQAEDYRAGGEGAGYHDSSPGNTGGAYRRDDVDIQRCSDGPTCLNVGWVTAGEWLAYDIQTTQSGFYVFTLRTASPYQGARLHIEIDGVDATGSVALPFTASWDRWKSVSSVATYLSAGRHTMRVVSDTGGYNLNGTSIASTTSATVWFK